MSTLALSNAAPIIEFVENLEVQKVSFKDESILLNSVYLRLEWTEENDVTLFLISGVEGNTKEREYKLSERLIPFNGQKKAICFTPFINTLLKAVNAHVTNNPPTSNTSFKTFTKLYQTSLLAIEYFALNGATSIKTSTKQAKSLIKDFEDGCSWYTILKTKDRFDEQYNERDKEQQLFIEGEGKAANRTSFELVTFQRIIGTSQFNKSMNEIPNEIISKLDVPHNIRTPYKYDGKVTKNKWSQQFYSKAFEAINALFRNESLSLPIQNTFTLSQECSRHESERTPTPTVEQVSDVAKALFGVLRNKDVLADLFEKVTSVIENPDFGSTRINNHLHDILSGDYTITLNGTSYHICGLRQIRGATKKEYDEKYGHNITLASALKTFRGSVAHLVLLFTGFRAEEVVDEFTGFHSNDYKYDKENNVTILNHYVSKGSVDTFSRREVNVGPIVGQTLSMLDDLNKTCSPRYCETSSLFQSPIGGTSGGGGSMLEISANTQNQNPLRYEFERTGLSIPTAKEYRRYFAVMYFYQFDDPNIKALQQHYAHSSEDISEVYVTDADARKAGKRIKDRIPSKMIPSASQLEDPVFRQIMEDSRSKKLLALVQSALNIKSIGAFQKTVRATYRKIYQGTEFSELTSDDKLKQAKVVTKHLEEKGYTVEVFHHGNCTNSKNIKNFLDGNCTDQSEGEIQRAFASGVFCEGCLFHDVQPQSIQNLQIEKDILKNKLTSDSIDDIFSDESLTPLEIEQTKLSISELNHVISLYQEAEL